MPSAASPPPPALQEATRISTATWQRDLEALFNHAKDRFPDVVWELVGDEDNGNSIGCDQVWGHKAIVYARAPPSFQARYFSFRPAPVSTPLPYSGSPNGSMHAQSALSLPAGLDLLPMLSPRSPSPFRAASPSPTLGPNGVLRLTTAINPTLFSNELEYLYTGKGLGEAFEFLFDTSESREEGDAGENRIDKLRKDFVFMWRSRLYSDVRIALTGNFSSTNRDGTATAVFSSHRFILVSRSSYFHSQLLAWGTPPIPKPGEPLTLNLPSPPFTPASLHFTLGYIYTGTLMFSHRTYDLETAFHIMRSANYLSIQTLYDEVQARIVQEMMHGLFHAFLEFSEYERVTAGKWGTGGCRCRQCARRAPRVLEFAMSDDVKNPHLDAGARRALVGLFGEGWCMPEFASLPQKTRESLLKGLAKRTTSINIFALLFAAQHALGKLNAVIEAWADTVRDMVMTARKTMDGVLCDTSADCFEQDDWLELMRSDGMKFEDGERVDWVMQSVKRGLSEKNAAIVYQTLVSSILLRPHDTETDATMLSNVSPIRAKVEDTRMEVLRWMRKRWMGIRQNAGFDTLEGWSLKEISGEIEVPVEDLFSLESTTPKGAPTKTGLRPSLAKPAADSESDLTSLRATVLSRNMQRPRPQSSASSVASTASKATTTTATVERRPPPGPRPDSKLSPSSSSIHSQLTYDGAATTSTITKTVLTRKISPRPPTATSTMDRPKSTTPSVHSTRSHASTIRRPSVGAGGRPSTITTTLRPPSSAAKSRASLSTVDRPNSSTSEAASFKTAADVHLRPISTRPRRTSTASTMSNVSVRTTYSKVASSPAKASGVGAKQLPPLPDSKLTQSPVTKRAPSIHSVKSTMSTASTTTPSPTTPKKPLSTRKVEKQPPLLPSGAANATPATSTTALANRTNGAVTRGKGRADALAKEGKGGSASSSRSASTLKSVKRKGSADTITKSTVSGAGRKKSGEPQPHPKSQPSSSHLAENGELPMAPHGSTLDIGIPCIISSKRKRFKAFARYIGEVEGEVGPWVGVEVPVGDSSWTAGEDPDRLDGPQWHDGTWGGIRYFEIGSEWDSAEDRAARRRRVEGGSGMTITGRQIYGVKREGDSLNVDRAKRFRSVSPAVSDMSNSESRGLFVRPQQVLYVVDAIGDL